MLIKRVETTSMEYNSTKSLVHVPKTVSEYNHLRGNMVGTRLLRIASCWWPNDIFAGGVGEDTRTKCSLSIWIKLTSYWLNILRSQSIGMHHKYWLCCGISLWYTPKTAVYRFEMTTDTTVSNSQDGGSEVWSDSTARNSSQNSSIEMIYHWVNDQDSGL